MHHPKRGTNSLGTFVQGQVASGEGRHWEVSGTIETFTGGSHQHAVIRSESGYTYLVPTHTLKEIAYASDTKANRRIVEAFLLGLASGIAMVRSQKSSPLTCGEVPNDAL